MVVSLLITIIIIINRIISTIHGEYEFLTGRYREGESCWKRRPTFEPDSRLIQVFLSSSGFTFFIHLNHLTLIRCRLVFKRVYSSDSKHFVQEYFSISFKLTLPFQLFNGALRRQTSTT